MSAPSLTQYVQGQGSASADNLNTFEQTCDNFAELRALTGVQGMQVFARGQTTPWDGQGGPFAWDSTSTAADDNATILRPYGAPFAGRWVLVPQSANSIDYTIPLPGGVEQTVTAKFDTTWSPTDFGATGTGSSPVADQKAFSYLFSAIQNSINSAGGTLSYAEFQNGTLIEPGIYDAGGLSLTGGNVKIVARIPGSVIIRIPDGEYFLTISNTVNSVVVDGVNFVGGLGAFKFTNTGNNVALMYHFTRCLFYQYTQCAIFNSANDQPYLRVEESIFYGSAGSSTIGIAWGGYIDQTHIVGNAFLQNAYHLALGPRLSSSIHVLRNDFISFGGAPTIADIWFKPNVDVNVFGSNSGYGTTIEGNKFGNENQTASQIRILVACEGAGTDRSNTVPSTADNANAYFSGLTIDNNHIAGIAGITAPFMQSNISQLREVSWYNNKSEGGVYAGAVNFLNSRTTDYSNTNSSFEFRVADGILSYSFSNVAGWAQVYDYASYFPGDPSLVEVFPVNADPTLTVLANAISPASLTVFSGASKSVTTDTNGGNDFSLVTCPSTGGGVYLGLPNAPSGGGMIFVGMMLGQAPSRSVAQVTIDIRNFTTQTSALQRTINLPATVSQVIIPVYMPPNASPSSWQLRVYPNSGVVSGTTDRFVTGWWVVNNGNGWIGKARELSQFPLLPRNPSMIGAAAGTIAIGWSSLESGISGLTTTITDTGCDSNGYYMDITLAGTASGTGQWLLYPEAPKTIISATGQIWQFYMPSFYSAGSLANLTSQTGSDGTTGTALLEFSEYNSGGTFLTTYSTAFTPTTSYALYGGSSFLINSSTTATLSAALALSIASGAAVNVTMRVYQPTIRRLS